MGVRLGGPEGRDVGSLGGGGTTNVKRKGVPMSLMRRFVRRVSRRMVEEGRFFRTGRTQAG